MSRSTDEIAAQAFQLLRAKARTDFDGNTQGLLVVYATESFLRRLAVSPYASQLVLKGGMLMAANDIRQMTKDGDLSARGLSNDSEVIETAIKRILRIAPIPHDGIVFEPDDLRTITMREADEYHGIRCKTTGKLGNAIIPLSLDISFGDIGSSEPTTISSVIDGSDIPVLAYPLTLNLAEKIVTAMQRGAANTRDRDFADLWVASRLHSIKAEPLREDIVAVANRREQPLVTLARALIQMPTRQTSYAAMLERMAYSIPPPEQWEQLLTEIKSFVDPLIEDQNSALTEWSPADLRWR